MAIKCIETATFLFLGLEKSVKTSSKNISSNFGIDLSRKNLLCSPGKSNRYIENVSDKSKIAEGLRDYICCFIICYDQEIYIPVDAKVLYSAPNLYFNLTFNGIASVHYKYCQNSLTIKSTSMPTVL